MNYLTIDVETSKKPLMNPWQSGSFIVCVCFKLNDAPVQRYLLRHATEFVQPVDVSLLEIQAAINAADVIVGHNVKFDLNWLKTIGLDFTGKKLWCTSTADYILQGQLDLSRKLNDVSKRNGFGAKIDEVEQYWNSGYETDEIPADLLLDYCAQDVELTASICSKQVDLITRNSLTKITELTFEVTDMLSNMELLGAKFDADKAKQYVNEYKTKLIDIDKKIFETVGYEFNLGSSAQLSACLYGGVVKKRFREQYVREFKSGSKTVERWSTRFEKVEGLGFAPIDGTEGVKAGQYSTSKKIIPFLRAETPEQKTLLTLLLERSHIDKIIEMFVTEDGVSGGLLNKLDANNRVHPSFNQSITVTGRLSSSDPNGQNLPRKGTSPVKLCFVPVNGVIMNVDLAQIEFRIAAELSRDPVMLREIKEGIDVHADNAIRFFGAGKYARDSKEFNDLRQVAKIFTFRLLYGGSANGFHRDGSMPKYSLAKWKSIVEAYYEKYAGLAKWQQDNVNTVDEQGYLRNPSGRVLRFKLVQKNGALGFKESAIYNYPVQSSSADIMYLAMATFNRRFKEAGLKSQFILQVHDSLVIDAFLEEVDTIAILAKEIFTSLPKLAKEYWDWDMDVPLDGDVEVGPSYGHMFKLTVKPKATTCTLKFTDGDPIDISVTKYIDLVSSDTYKDLIAKRKLTKIAFV